MHSQAYNLIYLHLFLQWNDGPQTRRLLWEFLVSRRQTALWATLSSCVHRHTHTHTEWCMNSATNQPLGWEEHWELNKNLREMLFHSVSVFYKFKLNTRPTLNFICFSHSWKGFHRISAKCTNQLQSAKNCRWPPLQSVNKLEED